MISKLVVVWLRTTVVTFTTQALVFTSLIVVSQLTVYDLYVDKVLFTLAATLANALRLGWVVVKGIQHPILA